MDMILSAKRTRVNFYESFHENKQHGGQKVMLDASLSPEEQHDKIGYLYFVKINTRRNYSGSREEVQLLADKSFGQPEKKLNFWLSSYHEAQNCAFLFEEGCYVEDA